MQYAVPPDFRQLFTVSIEKILHGGDYTVSSRYTKIMTHGLASVSMVYGFRMSLGPGLSEAQLRLAPNRPCMSLVRYIRFCMHD